MKSLTETTYRSIAKSDATITEESIEISLSILRGLDNNSGSELVSVLRTKEVARLLGVSTWSVHNYATKGLLEKVYGAGVFLLGISRASYIRFTEQRSEQINKTANSRKPVPPRIPLAERRAPERAAKTKKILSELHIVNSEPLNTRCQRITSYLSVHPEYSARIVCQAVGITPATYSFYKLHPLPEVNSVVARRTALKKAIAEIVPDATKQVSVPRIAASLKRKGIVTSVWTIWRTLDECGYIRRRNKRRPAPVIQKAVHERVYKRKPRGSYPIAAKRRKQTLAIIRRLHPEKRQSVVISHVRQELIRENAPLREYGIIRRILMNGGYRIFGQNHSTSLKEVPELNITKQKDTTIASAPERVPSSKGHADTCVSIRSALGISETSSKSDRLKAADKFEARNPGFSISFIARVVGVSPRALRWHRSHSYLSS